MEHHTEPSEAGPASSKTSAPSSQGSWLALLSSITLGPNASLLRVNVMASAPPVAAQKTPLRLVAQVYSTRALCKGRPLPGARPLASAQRAVSTDSLAQGVSIPLAGFDRTPSFGGSRAGGSYDRFVAVAWVEPGVANLEFDGANARPPLASSVGVAYVSRGQQSVNISLRTARARSAELRA